MKTIIKRNIIKLTIFLINFISGVFFSRKYLIGKWFYQRKIGWIWVLKGIWFQKILGFNRNLPIPTHPTIRISNFDNLILGKNNLNNFQSSGIYFQNYSAKIYIGDDCFIATNVGFITANHNPYNLDETQPGKDIVIGDKCWIGMNSVILPGVTLGNRTIVGAGSIVTKSFPDGNVIVAGNPAKIIRTI